MFWQYLRGTVFFLVGFTLTTRFLHSQSCMVVMLVTLVTASLLHSIFNSMLVWETQTSVHILNLNCMLNSNNGFSNMSSSRHIYIDIKDAAHTHIYPTLTNKLVRKTSLSTKIWWFTRFSLWYWLCKLRLLLSDLYVLISSSPLAVRQFSCLLHSQTDTQKCHKYLIYVYLEQTVLYCKKQ